MPSASTSTTLSAQRELSKLIPTRQPGKTVKELKDALENEGFDIHERSVQRYLNTLAGLYPITRSKDTPYRWYWKDKKAYDEMLSSEGISVLHALTLHMLKQHLAQTLPVATTKQMKPLFDLAEDRLRVLADSNDIARWALLVDVVKPGLPAIAPQIAYHVLEAVQYALIKGDKLKLKYTSAGKNTAREFRVNPIGTVQRGEKTYLVAIEDGRSEPTTYAMHRIEKADSSWEKSHLPDGVDLKGFIANGGLQFLKSRTPVSLKAWVSKMLGDQLAETKLEGQHLTPQGSKEDGYELIVTLPDSLTLRNWILSWTGHIEVLEPNTLREEIAVALRAGVARYR
jgi:predicted DNA-binding transcriptional regulator YafY